MADNLVQKSKLAHTCALFRWPIKVHCGVPAGSSFTTVLTNWFALQFVSIVTAAESRVIIRSTALLSRSLITLHTPRRRSHSAIHSAHFARDVEKLRLLRSTYNTFLLSLLSLQMPTTVIGCSATTATWMAAMLFGLYPVWLFLYYVDCGTEADPAFRFCYCYRCSDATNERVRIGDGTEQHSTPYSPAPGLKNM